MAIATVLNDREIWVRSQLDADQWRSTSMWEGRMGCGRAGQPDGAGLDAARRAARAIGQ